MRRLELVGNPERSCLREKCLRLWAFFGSASQVRLSFWQSRPRSWSPADFRSLARLFLCDLDGRSVEVCGSDGDDRWYKNGIVELVDGFPARVGAAGSGTTLVYPAGAGDAPF